MAIGREASQNQSLSKQFVDHGVFPWSARLSPPVRRLYTAKSVNAMPKPGELSWRHGLHKSAAGTGFCCNAAWLG